MIVQVSECIATVLTVASMLLTALEVLWAVSTVILISLLIYRNTLRYHEDDQLFLDEAEIHFAKEQQQLNTRIDSLQPWLRLFGAGSAVLLMMIAGLDIVNRVAAL